VHVQLGSWADFARLIAAGALVTACAGPRAADDVRVTWNTATTPAVGEPLVADVTLETADGVPVTGASLEIEGHMSHPGMAPVLAAAEEQEDGTYVVRFELTMAGDWIVLVKGVLPDGRTVSHRVDIANVQPSG